MKNYLWGAALACGLFLSTVACGPTPGDDGVEVQSEDFLSSEICGTSFTSWWGVVNDLIGLIPIAEPFERLFEIGLTFSSVGQRLACPSTMAELTELITEIAQKVVDEALIDQVEAQSTAIGNLLLNDPIPDPIVYEDVATETNQLEAAAATLSFEALPTMVGLASLKLSVRRAMLERATTGAEFHRQLVKMLAAIAETETRLDGMEVKLEAFLNEYETSTETRVTGRTSRKVRGRVEFPNGRYAGTSWSNCNRTDCTSARRSATGRANSLRRSKQNEVRNRVVGAEYQALRQSLRNARTAVLEQARTRNLAYNKPATQSSTYSSAEAHRAVDGNPDGNYHNGSVTHTQSQSQPYWQVDLGRTQGVEIVAIHNRTDCCGERLSQFDVELLDEEQNSVWRQTKSGTAGAVHYAFFRPGEDPNRAAKEGRYVRIRLKGSGALQLAEVYVFGVNMARTRPTDQSSNAHGGVSRRAVDGNSSGNYWDDSTTHTASETNAWWQVDLGRNRPVGDVVLYNRTDACCVSRLQNFVVQLRDSSGNVLGQQDYPDTAGTAPIILDFEGLQGQVVRVQRSSPGVLSLAEVEVFGPQDPQ